MEDKIDRYYCGNGEGMFKDDSGYYVKYQDHLDAVKSEMIEIIKYRFTPEGKKVYHEALKSIKDLKRSPYDIFYEKFKAQQNER